MEGLSVKQFRVGGFDKNFSYLVVDNKSESALLVDPCGDIDLVLNALAEHDLSLVAVFVTHTHPDHIEQLERVKPFNVPIYAHTNAEGSIQAELLKHVSDGDPIDIGTHTARVLHTPGHKADSICLYIEAEDAADDIPKLITGDTLFVERCGKTNKHDIADLWESLQRLMRLPDATEIYSGHDYGSTPVSTLGREKQENKYLRAPNLETFIELRLP